MRKIVAMMLALTMALVLGGCAGSDYKKALELFEQGQYEEAKSVFEELGDYRDSKEQVSNCKYNIAQGMFEQGQYEEAQTVFEELGEYQDSKEQVSKCKIKICEALIDKMGWGLIIPSYSALEAAEQALSYYNGLDEKEKTQVRNKDILATPEENEECRETLAREAAEERIEKEVLEEAVKEVKKYLKNPSSYQERTDMKSRTSVLWDEDDPTKVSGVVDIYYNALNDFGGRIDDHASSLWKGTYIDGVFTLTEMNIGLYMLVH